MSRKLNPEEAAQRRAEGVRRATAWNKTHPENCKKNSDAYRRRNPSKINALARAAYARRKEIYRERARQWRLDHHDVYLEMIYRSRLKKRYGITPEEFDVLYLKQNGRCAACERLFEEVKVKDKRRPHVDHDHKTGAVRGILCHGCNGALGLLGDDLNRAKAIVKYLESKS